MVSIFISHSQKDAEILNYFDRVFAGTMVKPIRAEFEKYERPPWTAIRSWVTESAAVFLLLGPNVRSTIFTSNWISFEVGLACNTMKPTWVFERFGYPVEFPVPYLTDYVLYDPANRISFEQIKEIVSAYDFTPQLAGAALGALLGGAFGKAAAGKNGVVPGALIGGLVGAALAKKVLYGIRIACPYPDCGISFTLHTEVNSFLCPGCRRGIRI